jgi:hypothetical protein
VLILGPETASFGKNNGEFFKKILIFSGYAQKAATFPRNLPNRMVNYLSSFYIFQVYKSSLFYQINNIINSEFVHNIAAVSFNCTQGPLESIGYFLVTFSIKNKL